MEQYELIDAAQKGNLEHIQSLLDAEVDVNQQDDSDNTALHFAPTVDIARLLLNHGAQVNKHNAFGGTPLHHAVFHNKQDIVRLLLERGACVKEERLQTSLPWLQIPTDKIIEKLFELALKNGYKDELLRLAKSQGIDSLNMQHILIAALPPLKTAQCIGYREIAELLEIWPILDAGSRASRLAFCMAMHPRLGAQSSAKVLSQHLFQEICSYIRPSVLIDDPNAIEDYRHIYEQQQKAQQTCIIC